MASAFIKGFRRQRFVTKLSSAELKLRLGLWILAFTLVINLIAYFNPNDKDNENIKTEDDVFAQRSVEDLIHEKG